MSSIASFPINPEFSESRFLQDLEKGSAAIGAPYSEETTRAILETYGHNFREGAVQLRATSRPGDALIYRLFTHGPIDALDIAVKHGLLAPDNPIAPTIISWRSLWEDAYEQLDFAADKGVTSAFLFLGAPRGVKELLDAPNVPEAIKANKQIFDDHELELVQAVGADYQAQRIAFYFISRGPLTPELAARYCAMARSPPPSETLYDDMSIMLGTNPFFFMVSMDFATGKIVEIQFYILFPIELPGGRLPEVGPRLTTYWDVDCYEEEEMDILGWCFVETGEQYLRADRGYCGGLRDILRDWRLMSVD
ncbi:hypothetical protein BP5796_09681 [Coleophoma crateriformis]|uniref:Uncharacterized protein n=1 Tax=Coleophoma crateriformis TaxID=565419 RepID=A0A3D8QYQ4_9HELO|nr:hypothetical protein BP5796_09681 [Coleophoma crateriformis]